MYSINIEIVRRKTLDVLFSVYALLYIVESHLKVCLF